MTAVTPELPRDLSNKQMVGRNGAGEIAVAFPRARMSREDALVFAAWLVLIAGGEDEFAGILEAIGGAA